MLGDGIQTEVDILGGGIAAAVAISLGIFGEQRQKKIQKGALLSLLGILAGHIISTIFSVDIGYSISYLIRLFSGFVVFYFFFLLSDKETIRYYKKCILLFVGSALAYSLILTIFPSLNIVVSQMNQIRLVFGHNHLADLFVFALPFIFHEFRNRKYLVTGMIIYFTLLSLFLARGAALFSFCYVLYQWFIKRHTQTEQKDRATAAIFVVIVVFGIVLIGGGRNIIASVGRGTIQARLGYYAQAIRGFISSPIVGNGPGTFSIVSSREAKFGELESWFAHSAPLQELSDVGIVGSLGIVTLAIVVVAIVRRKLRDQPISEYEQLTESIVLIILYSCFEFVIDYYVLWLLLCAGLGLLIGMNEEKISPDSMKSGMRIFTLIFGIYYLSSIAALVLLLQRNNNAAFIVAPYSVVNTIARLTTNAPYGSLPTDWLVPILHKNNPKVMFQLGDIYQEKDKRIANYYYRTAVFLQPQNMKYVSVYLDSLKTRKPEEAGKEVVDLLKRALPDVFHDRLHEYFDNTTLIGYALQRTYQKDPPLLKERYVSLLYSLGIPLLYTNTETTVRLWVIARDIYPDLATTHLELAGLYLYLYEDSSVAKQILKDCMKNKSAAPQCSTATLYPPGEYAEVLR